jgi:hypothetical protein
MENKPYILPAVDLSDDAGDPQWLVDGSTTPVLAEDGSIMHYRWNCPPGVHYDYWEVVQDEWAATVTAYENDPDDFRAAWHYLDCHPVYWMFHARKETEERPRNHVMFLESSGGIARGVYLMVVTCSPEGHLEEDDALNTRTMIWYETGKINLFATHGNNNDHWHDTDLDGGCDTYEQVIIELAGKIHEHYGNDRQVADKDEADDTDHR